MLAPSHGHGHGVHSEHAAAAPAGYRFQSHVCKMNTMSSFCVHGFPLCGPVAGGSAGHSLGSPELASEAFRCLLPAGSSKLTKRVSLRPYERSGGKGTRCHRVTRQLANRAAISGAGVGSRRPGRGRSVAVIEAVAARRTRAAAQAPAPATAAVQPNRSHAHAR